MSTEPAALATTDADRPPRHYYTAAAVAPAIDALEVAIGGRAKLIEALVAVDPSENLDYVVGLIADPRADTRALSALCKAGGVTVGELLAAYKAGVMARATVAAIQKVAEGMPAVVEDVMRRAAPYEDACHACGGTGSVVVGDDKPRAPCPTCQATGRLQYTPDLDRQKLALSLTPLSPKAPAVLVNTTVDNRALTLGDASPAGYAKLLEVTDRILRTPPPRAAPRTAAAEGGVREGEVSSAGTIP